MPHQLFIALGEGLLHGRGQNSRIERRQRGQFGRSRGRRKRRGRRRGHLRLIILRPGRSPPEQSQSHNKPDTRSAGVALLSVMYMSSFFLCHRSLHSVHCVWFISCEGQLHHGQGLFDCGLHFHGRIGIENLFQDFLRLRPCEAEHDKSQKCFFKHIGGCHGRLTY